MCVQGFYCPPGASRMTRCPAGRYGDDIGLNSSLCSGPCDPGHYCEIGSTRAKGRVGSSGEDTPCPAGTYNGSHGLTSAAGCAPCPAGTGCPSGSAEAIKCLPGTVAPNTSTAVCAKCVGGKYQALAGREMCDDCEAGSY